MDERMIVLSIINLKGGVSKTISAINIAHIMAEEFGKRVLLIDNDKQGNTTKFFKLHDEDAPSISDVLTVKGFHIRDAAKETRYKNLHVIPSNMSLLNADKQILMDCARPQQTRLKKALAEVANDYDFVVIDNAPNLDMSVNNALVASDHVLIPIKIDQFAFDGVAEILYQIDELKEFNEHLRVVGGFVTMYQHTRVNREGTQILQNGGMLPMLETKIRRSTIIDETTFAGIPVAEYTPRSMVTKDFKQLVSEYLELCQ